MTTEMIRTRARVMKLIKQFFDENGYLEVHTPAMAPSFIPEPTIPLFKTAFSGSTTKSSFEPAGTEPERTKSAGDGPNKTKKAGANGPLFLLPSPELYHKKLLRSERGNIFEICGSFRRTDFFGEQHNPEFTMVEWYTVDADYRDSARLTEELFAFLKKESVVSVSLPFRRRTVAELFWEYCDIDLATKQKPHQLYEECARLGLQAGENESWEELYHRIFLAEVEPNIPKDVPTLLFDYPHQIACLAKRKENTPWRERWELYAGGLEIANCFTEETKQERVEAFFRQEADKLPPELKKYIDWDFPLLFGPDYPRCSGVATGFDRLLMYLTGVKDIREVLLFPFYG